MVVESTFIPPAGGSNAGEHMNGDTEVSRDDATSRTDMTIL
jgi:hypothetical protein